QIIGKIEFLRGRAPNAKIEVDGGINLEIVKLVKEAGADIIVSASYIFQSKNPKAAFEELTRI
ncbi:MAG: ribulose-phosphate 3-epimerase, partial [Patescibacteria group bacterium]